MYKYPLQLIFLTFILGGLCLVLRLLPLPLLLESRNLPALTSTCSLCTEQPGESLHRAAPSSPVLLSQDVAQPHPVLAQDSVAGLHPGGRGELVSPKLVCAANTTPTLLYPGVQLLALAQGHVLLHLTHQGKASVTEQDWVSQVGRIPSIHRHYA